MNNISLNHVKMMLAVVIASNLAYFTLPIGGRIMSLETSIEPVAEYSSGYYVTRASCKNTVQNCDTINFVFAGTEMSVSKIPRYEVQDLPLEDRLEITFHDINAANMQLNYDAMTQSAAIDELNYYQVGQDLIVIISRNGEILPVKVSSGNDFIDIYLPSSPEGNIVFSSEEPVKDSVVYPARQEMGIEMDLKAPLKEARVFFQDSEIEFIKAEISPGRYSIKFTRDLENDQQYKVKVIVIDEKDRVAAAGWEFGVQKRAKAVKLNGDRFKYLGWWGKINANAVALYEEPTTQSKKLGTFSTINSVKVLEEISGESIKRNNLWYKIDGGAHPGAYILSSYVTAMAQPEAPFDVKIPNGIKEGEYWVDVDLTKRVLTLFQNDKPIFATYVATGRPGNPTLTGTYKIWYKLEKTRMRGGPPTVAHYYNLPNVPSVMYYRGSYALHGTYWHDKFSTRQSAGCTNLTQGDAKFIFDLVNPKLPENSKSVRSTPQNPGTVVYNHY